MLAEFRHLGGDDHLAVALVGVGAEVALVVGFGGVEGIQGEDFGDDGVGPQALGFEVLDGLLGDGFLLLAVVEDGGAVLDADAAWEGGWRGRGC